MYMKSYAPVTASLMLASAPAVGLSYGHAVAAPRAPKKQSRAERRARHHHTSDGLSVRRRSKNPPTKRKLKANRLHVAKRAKRRLRRARRG
jgi:hypothetical protein